MGIRVKLLGTPAEEGGGGKIILLDNGAFEDAKCSMMIHPGYENVVNPTFTTIQQYTVEFFGKDAHAAGVPRSFTLIPKSLAKSCNPKPAPIDAVAMILCPHACPISGKASYSTHKTTRGPESPKVTSKAVSRLCEG